MKTLVTGTAGFIGFHLAKALVEKGYDVIGLDNINDYYDVNLKFARLKETGISSNDIIYNKLVGSTKYSNYQFIKLNLEDKENINRLFAIEKFDNVCHLGAQAGVRYSLINPDIYIQSNIIGFLNILEASRSYPVSHLTYASSSSVYGLNKKQPFSTKHDTCQPISLYAVTKKTNELMAHSYSYLFGIPTTGLRFFTVYGPWGRPDMAPHLFTKAIIDGHPIDVYNDGNMKRDFTYIDDIVNGIIRVLEKPPSGITRSSNDVSDNGYSEAPYRIYNIGNNQAVGILDFIETIEKKLGIMAIKNFLPLQDGDMPTTLADISEFKYSFNYQPIISVNEGVENFVKWYKSFYFKKHSSNMT